MKYVIIQYVAVYFELSLVEPSNAIVEIVPPELLRFENILMILNIYLNVPSDIL